MSETGVSYEWDRAYQSNRLLTAADWFYWLAAFALANAIWGYFSADRAFLLGPGISMVANAIILEAAPQLRGAGLAFGVAVTIVMILFGWFARRSSVLFAIGFVLYLLDAALVALIQLWLHLAVHAYVLYKMGTGIDAIRKLNKLPPESEGATATVPEATS